MGLSEEEGAAGFGFRPLEGGLDTQVTCLVAGLVHTQGT